MSPHQTMFPVFYDVLGLELACWQIFSHAEIFLIRKKVSLQLFDMFKRNRAFISDKEVGELVGLISPMDEIDRVSKFDNFLSFGAKQNALQQIFFAL